MKPPYPPPYPPSFPPSFPPSCPHLAGLSPSPADARLPNTSTLSPDQAGPLPHTLASASARRGLPPGPRAAFWGLPLLRRMQADFLGFARERQARHGDLVGLRIGWERAVDLFSPELVRAALVDHAAHLRRWERGTEVFAQAFGQSVLTTEGATWQRQRRMLQPAFTPRRVAGYASLMVSAAEQGLRGLLPPGAAEAEVDMDALFARLAMDVILRTLFGQADSGSHGGDRTDEAIWATRVLGESAMHEMFWPLTLPDWLPLPGKADKRRALRSLRALVGAEIARGTQVAEQVAKQGAAEGGDHLLAQLLALRDEATGAALSPAEVFDQCMVTFQAGHETTATALLWWSRFMAEHPEAQARARAEVDALLGPGAQGRAPGPEDLAALPWLQATLKEAMRLVPPIPALMTRRTTAEITLGGWVLPAGTLLYLTPWVLHHDPRWFPEPAAYRPERFMPDAPPPPKGAYLPFGWGPRVCIGQHFAQQEMALVAAMLLQRHTLGLLPGAAPAEPVLQITLRPRGGLRLRLGRR